MRGGIGETGILPFDIRKPSDGRKKKGLCLTSNKKIVRESERKKAAVAEIAKSGKAWPQVSRPSKGRGVI